MPKKNIVLKILKLFLYCLLAFIFNQVIQLSFPTWKVYPNFIYTLIWVFAYFNPGMWSLGLGLFAGFFHDWLFSPIMGMGIFVGMLTSIVSSGFLQRIWEHRIGFLFVQTIILQIITKFFDSLIIYLIFALRYDLPVTFNILQGNYLRNLPLTFLLNIGAVCLWLLLIRFLIPFEKVDKNMEFADFSENTQEVL